MRAIEFNDIPEYTAVQAFSDWMKGRCIAKDVVIHSHETYSAESNGLVTTIIIFYDEVIHKDWHQSAELQELHK